MPQDRLVESKVVSMKASQVGSPVSRHAPAPVPRRVEEEDECPLYILVTTYLGYLMMAIFGHVRDFFGKIFKPDSYKHLRVQNVYKS